MICEKCGNEAYVILTCQDDQNNSIEKHPFCRGCIGNSAEIRLQREGLKTGDVHLSPFPLSCATILVVQELSPSLQEWGRVYLDPNTLSLLKVVPGDTVSIQGHRTTVARVHLADPNEWKQNIIGVDDLVRQNAGVQYGDKVIVHRKDSIAAKRVMFALLDTTMTDVDLLVEAALPYLQIIPLTTHDVVPLYGVMPPFSDPLWFKVVHIEPAEAVMVTESTKVEFEGGKSLSVSR